MRIFALIASAVLAFPAPGATAQPGPAAAYAPVVEWMKAGVTGGIPVNLPVVATLRPGDNVQSAIDAAPATGGVIVLTHGEFVLTEPLRLRSGILLRGVSPRTSRLQLKLRGARPEAPDAAGLSTWTSGVLLQAVERAGLANLTISFDTALPAPPDPRTSAFAYVDNPGNRSDLHVVAVRFTAAHDCWISNCIIRNSGNHPLWIEASRHVTVDEVEIDGAHNKGNGSGYLGLTGSEYTLLSNVQVRNINSVLLHAGAGGPPCRYNVFTNDRIEVDIRLHGTATARNLFENCVIAVPAWHNRPPFSPGNADARESPPGPENLLYLCTVTRDFSSGGRSFSLADDPTKVYRVIETNSREGGDTVVVAGPGPAAGSLLLAR